MRSPARGVQRALWRLRRPRLFRVPARRPAAAAGRVRRHLRDADRAPGRGVEGAGPIRRRAGDFHAGEPTSAPRRSRSAPRSAGPGRPMCWRPSRRSTCTSMPRLSGSGKSRLRCAPHWRPAPPARSPITPATCVEHSLSPSNTDGERETRCTRRAVVVPSRPCSPASSPTSASSSSATAGASRIRCSYPAASIAVGASIACDGACLTATAVKPSGQGSTFTVDVSNETLSKTTLGGLAAWPAHQPGAGAEGRRRAGRAYRLRPRRRRRPHPRHPPRWRQPTLHHRGAGGARPLHRAQGLGGAGRHLAHRQRGRRKPAWACNIIPHTLTHTTLSAKKPGDALNLEVDVFARYVVRAMELRR